MEYFAIRLAVRTLIVIFCIDLLNWWVTPTPQELPKIEVPAQPRPYDYSPYLAPREPDLIPDDSTNPSYITSECTKFADRMICAKAQWRI